MPTVEQLMATEIVKARPVESVADVAQRMRKKGAGAALLMDGDTVCGIFTERDALYRVIAAGRDYKTTRVGEVATRVVITTDVHTPLRTVLKMFRENKSRHLPVVNGNTLVGMLSVRDFLDRLVDGFERQLEAGKAMPKGYDPFEAITKARR